ncbi:MAG: carbamoyltransferase [Candidatus Marinimicrobia bacterium]|nr:carbamoyltransferase [Candidatus Neomarinimicrobiota bacterium]MCF7827642.1 carbamoyltransferase [Candidatus Neomarinimicrobiota bacterium]MCF7881303.1 carbamoyltransferase [Candidatus Neomarinimicrobiota bacterium]
MSDSVYILGISAFYHDSAAVLVCDGNIIAAIQEERFTRRKHDFSFPENAVAYCLQEADITPADLSYIGFYDKPFRKFERILETYLQYAPRGFRSFIKAIPVWIKQKIWIKSLITDALPEFTGEILFPEHHRSHAASAFFPSPFSEAAIITTDGVGEWTTTSIGFGRDNQVNIYKENRFPHSLGMLYSAFTYYTGFRVNSGEYKVMGLAPYGEPKYVQTILDHLIDVKGDGSFRLNMEYFNYPVGLTMTNRKFHGLFGGPPRRPESDLTQKDMDLARSVQEVIEMVILRMAHHTKSITGSEYLVLAGGVALNCVANGKLLRSGVFNDIWIQPAAGDAGGALGAALGIWYEYMEKPRAVISGQDGQHGSFLGPAYKPATIESFLERFSIPYRKLSEDTLFSQTAELLAQENVIGWFQGRMEYGPRALGARSILGDPRSPEMQRKMNLKIKFRESFRPFAPSVLFECVSDYFKLDRPSPYMLLVAEVADEQLKFNGDTDHNLFGLDRLHAVQSEIPAVTHVDNSARIQTVHQETHPRYHALISAFANQTGCPVLVNTSFNVRGEPIVRTPRDAYKCFMRTEMDYLVLGDFLLDKTNQPGEIEALDWDESFKLD